MNPFASLDNNQINNTTLKYHSLIKTIEDG